MRGRGAIARAVLAASLISALSACGKGAAKKSQADESTGMISVDPAFARQEATAASALVATLKRGTQIKAGAARNGFVSVLLSDGRRAWIPQGTFERSSELVERQERTREVQGFAPQPGLTVERTLVFLAPDYGAAQWGEIPTATPVEVLTTRGDFLGLRLPGLPLGFVASRSVQLVPPEPTPTPEPENPPEEEPEKPAPRPAAREVTIPPAREVEPPDRPAVSSGPYESLPEGSERPILKKEVKPRYPDGARRAGVQGIVILRILVKRDGTVGSVQILRDLPMGLGQVAAEAVKEYEYEPARVEGVPVDVYLTTTVRFSLGV